jgi:hypothetical protein
MVEEHDKIVAAARGKRIDWPTVCAEAAKRGKTDTAGKAPSVANAKKTWQRARREVAATRAAEAAKPPQPIYPSRVAKDWRPAGAPPPDEVAARPALGLRNELVPIRTNLPQEIEPYDPDKQMARLRGIMAERSGRTRRE